MYCDGQHLLRLPQCHIHRHNVIRWFHSKVPALPCDKQPLYWPHALQPRLVSSPMQRRERSVPECPGDCSCLAPCLVCLHSTPRGHTEKALVLYHCMRGSVTYLTPRLVPRCWCCQQLAWHLSPHQRQQSENEYPGMGLPAKGECNCDCECRRPGGDSDLGCLPRMWWQMSVLLI